MTLEELDIHLEELEVRLERLRALYEQYFLGFEKIEPSVARKDVDRRIYVMRREKIRNTGRRFKLQTLIQRYNTFQQYWQRICREIENGTYRRHVLRAERQLAPGQQLTIAARRRFGKTGVEATESARASGAPPPAPASAPPARSSAPPEREPSTLPAPRPAPAAAGAPDRRATAAPRPRPSDRAFESLELDMGFLGDWTPDARPPARTKSSPRNPAPAPGSSPRAATEPQDTRSSPRAAPPAAQTATGPQPSPASPATDGAGDPQQPERKPLRPGAQRPPKPQRPEAAASEGRSGMSDDRIRELHRKLSEAKRQNQETGRVSLDSLARSLRETENKLRAQHKNRKIDFEVVIRDGKAIVKPTVR